MSCHRIEKSKIMEWNILNVPLENNFGNPGKLGNAKSSCADCSSSSEISDIDTSDAVKEQVEL